MIPQTPFSPKAIRVGGYHFSLKYSDQDIRELHDGHGIDWSQCATLGDRSGNALVSPEAVHFCAVFVWLGIRSEHNLSLEAIERLLKGEIDERPAVLFELRSVVGRALAEWKKDFDRRFRKF